MSASATDLSIPLPLLLSAPVPLYSAAQTQQFDVIATANLLAQGYSLMQQAGVAALQILNANWPDANELLVLCGKGNNGGDGMVLATLALARGYRVQVVLTCSTAQLTDCAKLAAADALAQGVAIIAPASIKWPPDESQYVIVDALLGTGLTSDVKPPLQQLICQVNSSLHPVLAIDVPSGINATTGAQLGCAIKAAITVTMIAYKHGLFTGDGAVCCGRLYLAPLTIASDIITSTMPYSHLISWQHLQHSAFFQPRPLDVHKRQLGHVVVIGGDLGYGGAVTLAAGAALRSGAGMVSVITRPEHVTVVLAHYPEAMVYGCNIGQDIRHILNSADVIVIGPGLGQQDWGVQLLQQTMMFTTPLVIDADALNILAAGVLMHNLALRHTVITPHPGEAARLLKLTSADIQADRVNAAQQLAQLYKSSVVLKGLGSLILSGDALSVCYDGNPGMASAGMGDVLSGILASLFAQHCGALPALLPQLVNAAVCLHSAAADLATAGLTPTQTHQTGLLASDVIAQLRSLRN